MQDRTSPARVTFLQASDRDRLPEKVQFHISRYVQIARSGRFRSLWAPGLTPQQVRRTMVGMSFGGIVATPLATYKYDHGQGGGWRLPLSIVLLVWAILFVLALLVHPGLILVCLVGLLITLWLAHSREVIKIGPRYLICGHSLVYFGQVHKIERHGGAGLLRLHLPGGHTWELDRERFPTNARKEQKIAANKAKKFTSISDKIIEKVRRANPQVKLHQMS